MEVRVMMFSTGMLAPMLCGDAEERTLSMVERAQMFCGVAVVGMIFQGLAVMMIFMAAMGLIHWMEAQAMTGCGAARRLTHVLVSKFTNARASTGNGGFINRAFSFLGVVVDRWVVRVPGLLVVGGLLLLSGCVFGGGPSAEQIALRDEIHVGAVAAMDSIVLPDGWEIVEVYESAGAVSTDANQNNPAPGIYRFFIDVGPEIDFRELILVLEGVVVDSGGVPVSIDIGRSTNRAYCYEDSVIAILLLDGYNITVTAYSVDRAKASEALDSAQAKIEINHLAARKTTYEPRQFIPTDEPILCE